MVKYTRDRTKLLDWIETKREIKEQAKQNFMNTDYAFKLYNQAHPDKQIAPPKEPRLADFYHPSFSVDLQPQPFDVVSAAAGRPWARVHGKRDQRNGKPQNNHSPWAL